MRKHIAVLLSGCGAWDGSDIHETVITLLALDRAGADVTCTAPNMEQHHVLNHITQEADMASRNVLTESARLARGNIIDLASLDASQLDALVMPGGFGTVKNLSQFALRGPIQEVDHQVSHLVKTLLAHEKPIGAIALAAIPLVISMPHCNPEVTVSDDKGIIAAIEALGGKHHHCHSGEIFVDNRHQIVTTPKNTTDPGIVKIAEGIDRLVAKVIDLIG